MKPSQKSRRSVIHSSAVLILLWSQVERASAAQFESLKSALTTTLKSSNVYNINTTSEGKPVTIYYSKGAGGKPERVAFIEKGTYEPNCTHTWVIGLDSRTAKVTQVRVVELSCVHAYPTNKANFLDQYKGKGPADVAKLSDTIQTIAKATGSCNLATDAVKRSITAWNQNKGKI